MKPFILSSLLALSVISFSSAQAIPTPEPHIIELINTGTESIYYALSGNATDYTSLLSIQVNGLADKNDVVGVIMPYASEKLTLTPLPNYYKFSNAVTSQYSFTFGHSLTSAQKNMNYAEINTMFNFYSGGVPFTWQVGASSPGGISCSTTVSDTTECQIDSDSSAFVY